ncbi:VOC family protein [bacterium]|nr:VOC family protein [bacterium]
MIKTINFFEIPATDFNRATNFYEKVFDKKLSICECETEQMGFFQEGDTPIGAISCAKNFNPGEGVVIYFDVKELDKIVEKIVKFGGKIITPKTRIEADCGGDFAIFLDSEGNRVGVYSQNI